MTLKYIRGQPDYVEGVGNVYPVRIKDYDEFNEVAYLLNFGKEHFQNLSIPLLPMIVLALSSIKQPKEIISDFEKLFSIITRKEVKFGGGYFVFEIDNEHNINPENYDKVREISIKQNLIFPPKVYKNKTVQKWAEKVLEVRKKNAPKITMEDMLSTISAYNGKSYEELDNYTIYQVYSEFNRIRKIKNYDISMIARMIDGKVKVEDYAENLDLFRSPYDDLFVNKDKLNKLNKALENSK